MEYHEYLIPRKSFFMMLFYICSGSVARFWRQRSPKLLLHYYTIEWWFFLLVINPTTTTTADEVLLVWLLRKDGCYSSCAMETPTHVIFNDIYIYFSWFTLYECMGLSNVWTSVADKVNNWSVSVFLHHCSVCNLCISIRQWEVMGSELSFIYLSIILCNFYFSLLSLRLFYFEVIVWGVAVSMG